MTMVRHILMTLCSMVVFLMIHSTEVGAAAQKKASAAKNGEPQPIVTLDDTIKATLENHRALRAIQENKLAMEHERDRAVRGYGPRVDVTGGAGVGILSDTTTRQYNQPETFNTVNRVGATLTQPLWDGFATRSRVRAAQATLNSITHRVFDNATTLSLDAIIAHIDVLRRKEILKLAQENVNSHEEILGMSREREKVGADTLADVAKAESRLARAQSSRVDAQTSLLDGYETYKRLTNLSPYARLQPVPAPPEKYQSQNAVLEDAQTHNPKLAAYLQDINAATGQQQLTQSAYYPTINLEAGPNYTARGDERNTWTYSLDIMGVFRWNIFNSGADVAADKAAAARVRQSRQVMYSFYDDLKLEVEKTWTALQAARQQYIHWTEAEKFSTQTRDAYRDQFLMGQRSLLDLLDAENELFSASTQKVTAQGNIYVSGYRLLALSGVLLSDLHIPAELLDAPPPPPEKDPREKY